jgi:molecular chaperone DnaK (HSP70)
MEAEGGLQAIEVQYQGQLKQFKPEEISAMVLTSMNGTVEAFLYQPISDSVITCPAYFNNVHRQAPFVAWRIVGLNVLRVINEPTPVAIAYGLDKRKTGKRNVLIFDLVVERSMCHY